MMKNPTTRPAIRTPPDQRSSPVAPRKRGRARKRPPIAVSTLYHKERLAAFDRVAFGQQNPREALEALQANVVAELRKTAK